MTIKERQPVRLPPVANRLGAVTLDPVLLPVVITLREQRELIAFPPGRIIRPPKRDSKSGSH